MQKSIKMLYIPGDGIGPEVINSMIAVSNAVFSKSLGYNPLIWAELNAGEKSFREIGTYLPDETILAIEKEGYAIKGPMGTPIGGGHRSLNVALRQKLDLYSCERPVKYFDGYPSPLKNPGGTDLMIFRENTEDLYAGIEFKAGDDDNKKIVEVLHDMGYTLPEEVGIGIKPISKENTNRIMKSAMDYALKNGKNIISIVHKGNILKFTEGQFLKWCQEFAINYNTGNKKIIIDDGSFWKTHKEVPADSILINNYIADNAFAQAIKKPQQFQVIVTTNLNGDYLSDAFAECVGGLGITGGLNANHVTKKYLAEAVHGTAPDIAGLNEANAYGVILSSAQLFEVMGYNEESNIIIESIQKQIATGNQFTKDALTELRKQDFEKYNTLQHISTTKQRDELIKIINNL